MAQDKLHDVAMALLTSTTGYQGFQYLAVGTGDSAWDNLIKPPDADPSVNQLFPYSPPAQQERISFLNGPVGGTFQLGYMGVNTATLAFSTDASGPLMAAIMQAALESLSTIGAGNITVVSQGGNVFLATFAGSLSSGPRSLITQISSGLLEPDISNPPTPTIDIALLNNPAILTNGEFFRIRIDNAVFLDENGLPLTSGISRYIKLSATIPAGAMSPASGSAPPIVWREIAWVGGIGASLTLGTGLYLAIIRTGQQIRRFNDGQITISSNIKI